MVSQHKEKVRQDSEWTEVETETETETDGPERAEPLKPPSGVVVRPFQASDTTVATGNANSGVHVQLGSFRSRDDVTAQSRDAEDVQNIDSLLSTRATQPETSDIVQNSVDEEGTAAPVPALALPPLPQPSWRHKQEAALITFVSRRSQIN